MDKMIWDENFSVGIKEIDSQHQHLFSLINKLIESSENSSNSKMVDEALEKMVYYARYHFKAEEDYMKSIDYKEFKIHKKEHLGFIKKITELSIQSMKLNNQVMDELLSFLIDWWTKHILNSDKKYIKQS